MIRADSLSGEYYAVKFNDGTYYRGSSFYFNNQRTTDIEDAELYQFDWQITKDRSLKQFLFGKDLICEYVKVRVITTVELI